VAGDPHAIERVDLKKLAMLTGEIHAHSIAAEGGPYLMDVLLQKELHTVQTERADNGTASWECRSELGAAASTPAPDRHRLHSPLP
jgi:hypothetical protein